MLAELESDNKKVGSRVRVWGSAMDGNSCRTRLFAVVIAFIVTQSMPGFAETVRVDGNKVKVNAGKVQINSTNFSLIGGGTTIIIKEWRGKFPGGTSDRYECPADTMKYVPVCARTHNYMVATYSNRCFARIDSAVVLTGDGEPCPPVNCHALYQPVCARVNPPKDGSITLDRPEIRPFMNRCMAENYKKPDSDEVISTTVLREYGVDIYVNGGRRYEDFDEYSRICPRDGTCPPVERYVCAEDHNQVKRIYQNRCMAVLEGAVYKYDITKTSPACR